MLFTIVFCLVFYEAASPLENPVAFALVMFYMIVVYESFMKKAWAAAIVAVINAYYGYINPKKK